ncbi:MAG: VPLPA-CTERM sorting domain-containing protein [Silicimonas sp.]|nr:VPLPA-CTERM sorting domain-containing protein [Silicimonas sp.]
MNFKPFARRLAAGLLVSTALAGAASAAVVQVTITNNQASDAVYLTPLLSVFHDGSFDSFDLGRAASASVEALAEEGNPALVAADAQAAGATTGVVFGPAGFAGAPVLDPGETASIRLDVDPSDGRYFSFLSMVIPSNDIFIGNDNPLAYRVFDADGKFTGLGPISVYANDAWDAGTEVNNGQGAPFNTAGGTSTEVDGVITQASDSLFFLNGQDTVAGTTISLPTGANLLATIEVSQVPLPAGAPLLLAGLGAFGWMRRRQRS